MHEVGAKHLFSWRHRYRRGDAFLDFFSLQKMHIALVAPTARMDNIVDFPNFQDLRLLFRGGDKGTDTLNTFQISGLG